MSNCRYTDLHYAKGKEDTHEPKSRRQFLYACWYVLELPFVVEAYKAHNNVIVIINGQMINTRVRCYPDLKFSQWKELLLKLKKDG